MENEIITIDGFVIGEIYKNTSLSDMTGEKWKDIPGFEGRYQASSLGRIKSILFKKHKIIKQSLRGEYLRVSLGRDNKDKSVHRLIALTFIKNVYNKPQVNHINECKTDNRACNLNYMTPHENHVHGTGMRRMLDSRTGLFKEKPVLCVETGVVYRSACEASRQTGAPHGNISTCCRGKRKTTGGYHWQYAD